MKISMVSEHASPLAAPGSVDAGGQNVHVAALSRSLARRGHTVTVYTRRDRPDLPRRVALDQGVDVVHVPAGPAAPVPKDDLLPHMGELAAGLTAEWRTDRPDVVHGHFWMSGLAALDAVSALDPVAAPPVLQTFHALGVVKRRHQGAADTSPPERTWLEPRVGREADTVIATCTDEAFELRALGVPSRRLAIAPCGADLALFRPEGPAERKRARHRIVTVSRLVPRKGVDLVVEAMRWLSARGFDDVELVVAGSSGTSDAGQDPEIERLTRLAEDLGVSDRVCFRGQVERERVPALLRSADLVACTPWYEPFGIVPIEAMACGTPVVAASVGGLIDTVVDGITGAHVPPHDARALGAAFHDLLSDDDRRAALGAAGCAHVRERYSWDRVAAQTERIYVNTLRMSRQHFLHTEGAAL